MTFLETEDYILRPLDVADVDGEYQYWLNDREVVQYNSHGRFPKTKPSIIAYINAVNNNTSNLVLAIVDKKNYAHIGNISLQNINWVDRNAEIAFLLGNKDYWSKGVMLEVGKKIIEHGFSTLNLHRIYCGTSSANIGMQKLAVKLGMQLEGRRREAIFKDGHYFDVLEYGILRLEYPK